MTEGTTRQAIAQGLSVSVSTLRKYERLARRLGLLDTPAGERGQGTQNVYSAHDVDVFMAIDHLRRVQRHSYQDMADGRLLQQTLAAGAHRVSGQPYAPEDAPGPPEDAPGAAESTNQALIPVSQFVALMGKYQATEGALAAVTEERDRLLEDLARLHQQVTTTSERAARAEGQLEILREQSERRSSAWWRKLFGRQPTPPNVED